MRCLIQTGLRLCWDQTSRLFILAVRRYPLFVVRKKKTGPASAEFYLHIGLYAFRKDVLLEITRLPQSALEKAESLEQLRWLENGFHIAVRTTTYDSFGIDTPEDLAGL